MTRSAARGEFSPAPGVGATVGYNGGPVMHGITVYAIFWQPSSRPLGVSAFSSGYEPTVDDYLRDSAADSGKPSNVFSVTAQYADAGGAAQSSIAFGGSYSDTNSYPVDVVGGCTDTDVNGHNLPVCLKDTEIQNEIQNDVSANHWPTGLGALYLLFTPAGVGSCFGPGAPSSTNACAYSSGGYCAYHGSNTTGNVIYANLPYEATFTVGGQSDGGCEDGSRPNGSDAGPAIDTASHEQNEAVTDPLTSGSGSWWDSSGTPCVSPGNPAGCNPYYNQEIADLCVDYSSPLDWYGSMLATSPPYVVPNGANDAGAANQAMGNAINPSGFDAWLFQQEWSNAAGGCVQRAPQASFTATPAAAGSPMTFDGSGSSASSGHAGDPVSISSWQWSFDDGTSATGETVAHTFCTPGTHRVTLTVTDSAGDPGSAAEPVIVSGSACGSAPPTTTGGQTTKPMPTPSAKPVLSLSVRQRGKQILLGTLSCPAGCVLTAHATAAVAHRAGRRVRVVHTALGMLKITLHPGGHATLRLVLSRSGQALLHRMHHLSVTVTIRLSGPTGTTNYTRHLVVRG
jgi:hypothetical protein